MSKQLLVASCLLLLSAPGAAAQPCDKVDADTKQAFSYLIDDAYRLGKIQSEDKAEVVWARGWIVKQGTAILPCLLEIYHGGVPKGDLWQEESALPTDGRWAITLIGEIDPKSAVPLYRELRAEATESLTKVKLSAEIAILGDPEYLPEIMQFLDNPPEVTRREVRKVTSVQERALVAISVHNYRPAVRILNRLEESWDDKHLLRVYQAQLAGDTSTLLECVKDARVRDVTLLVLVRMGKEEIVRQIADDGQHAARVAARAVLEEKLGR